MRDSDQTHHQPCIRRWKAKLTMGAIGAGLLALATGAAAPSTRPSTTQPADPTMDWLMGQSTTAPSASDDDVTTGKPVKSPLINREQPKNATRRGVMTLSSGERVTGNLATTAGKPLRIWDEKEQVYKDIPFSLVQSLDAQVLWERQEREWHFVESGSDIKEYSGKTYPAREMQYTLTETDGQTITGAIDAPIYVVTKDDRTLFVLHKRDKGPVGQSLKDLVYIAHISFGASEQPPTRPATRVFIDPDQ